MQDRGLGSPKCSDASSDWCTAPTGGRERPARRISVRLRPSVWGCWARSSQPAWYFLWSFSRIRYSSSLPVPNRCLVLMCPLVRLPSSTQWWWSQSYVYAEIFKLLGEFNPFSPLKLVGLMHLDLFNCFADSGTAAAWSSAFSSSRSRPAPQAGDAHQNGFPSGKGARHAWAACNLLSCRGTSACLQHLAWGPCMWSFAFQTALCPSVLWSCWLASTPG